MLFENETLKIIGIKYGKSVAQMVLRWLIQRDVVCIPKSVKENFKVFDFGLSEEDMQTIATMDKGTASHY